MSSQGGPKLVSIIGLLHLTLRTGLFWQEEEEEEQIGDIEREKEVCPVYLSSCPSLTITLPNCWILIILICFRDPL